MNSQSTQKSNNVALEVHNLGIQFGGLKAVDNFSLEIKSGEIIGLIGPNGAGKTTVFNLLTGVYSPSTGIIKVFGRNTSAASTSEIISFGMARTFQNIRLFNDLTVLENLLIATDFDKRRMSTSLWRSIFMTLSEAKLESEKIERGLELLKIFDMESRKNVVAKNLPYGDQRRLEILRAMATGAQLILLDEPAAGMNPQETLALMNTIKLLRDKYGMTILLIEHDMKLVMGICERIAVLDHGQKLAEGTPESIQNNPTVIEAYLGTPQ